MQSLMLMGQALYQLNQFPQPSLEDPHPTPTGFGARHGNTEFCPSNLCIKGCLHSEYHDTRTVCTTSLSAFRGLRYFSEQTFRDTLPIFYAKPQLSLPFNIFNCITMQCLSDTLLFCLTWCKHNGQFVEVIVKKSCTNYAIHCILSSRTAELNTRIIQRIWDYLQNSLEIRIYLLTMLYFNIF